MAILSLGSVKSYGQQEVKSNADAKVFSSVEQVPVFPGGQQGLIKYLADNIRYPLEAKEDNIQGKVIIQFVVFKDGSIGNILIKQDIGGGCGKEAMRVVASMRKWIPGRQNGQPVNVFFTLPISFSMSKQLR